MTNPGSFPAGRARSLTLAIACTAALACGVRKPRGGPGTAGHAGSAGGMSGSAGRAGAGGHGAGGTGTGPPGGEAGQGAGGFGAGGIGAGGIGAGGIGQAAFSLLGAPMVSAPTPRGFTLDTVLRAGDPARLRARVRAQGEVAWIEEGPAAVVAPDLARWSVSGLAAGRRYEYEIQAASDGASEPRTLYAGSAVTARPAGTPFTFAMIADTHIEPRDPIPEGQTIPDDTWGVHETNMLSVMREIPASEPDFLINLGDILDYHLFGFNDPPPDSAWARLGYLNYRRMLGDVLGQAAHFPVIGNWDGESGCNTAEEIARSTTQRVLYAPGPAPTTYPESGSPNQDYYAFTWGDALFIVLNVMTYTPTCHLLGWGNGTPDDWTLGAAQLAWLEQTLARATSRWRFTFIHHTVGGMAGNYDNSAYGRGGGLAAHVGEQAAIHAILLKYGVQIFFYAHDHVFTDMIVDGVHYTMPGSAGAPWKFDSSETGYQTYWPDSGYGRVRVSPDAVRVDLIAAGGQVLAGYDLK